MSSSLSVRLSDGLVWSSVDVDDVRLRPAYADASKHKHDSHPTQVSPLTFSNPTKAHTTMLHFQLQLLSTFNLCIVFLCFYGA